MIDDSMTMDEHVSQSGKVFFSSRLKFRLSKNMGQLSGYRFHRMESYEYLLPGLQILFIFKKAILRFTFDVLL